MLLGFWQTSEAGISDEIAQLENAYLASAKEVVKSLDKIAQDKKNPESRSAIALSREIKKLFNAELGVQQVCQKSVTDTQKADELEQQGIASLKPNAFGSVDRNSAYAKYKAARDMRTNAQRQIRVTSAALATAVKDFKSFSQNLELSEQDREVLVGVADSIEERSIKEVEIANQEIEKNIENGSMRLMAQELKEEAKVADEMRNSALNAMQRAIKTGKRADEAKAMALLTKHAPDCVKHYTRYISARAARRSAADAERTSQEIDDIRRILYQLQ